MTLTAEPDARATTPSARPAQRLRHRLAERGVDGTLLLILPAVLITAAMAVTYMLVAVLGLAISLRFVTPSQAIRRRHR
jgi:hypothetical protein